VVTLAPKTNSTRPLRRSCLATIHQPVTHGHRCNLLHKRKLWSARTN